MARKLNAVDFRVEDFNGTGNLNGGQLFFYEAGTSTKKATYPTQADAIAATNANANPVVLGSDGRPTHDIWLLTDTKYKVVVATSTDTDPPTGTTTTYDNVAGTLDPLTAAYKSKSIQFDDGDGLEDANGNEVLAVKKTASAVNEIQMTNAATGSGPTIDVTGDDSNTDLNIKGKGTGSVALGNAGLKFPNSDGSANQVIETNGSGQLSFVAKSADTTFPRNYRDPISVISNDTDTDHDIKIMQGHWRDVADAVNIDLTADITKQIDASWAEGDDAGGFPTGISLSADTWYHVFVIHKTADGTIDAGFDTSTTATNLLADATGYSGYRRVGSVLTDSSSNITQFTQVGDTFYWKDPGLEYNSTTLGTTAGNITLATPLDYKTVALMNAFCTIGSGQAHVYIRSKDANDEAPSTSAAPIANVMGNTNAFTTIQVECMTNTSSQVGVRSDAANTTLRVSTIAYRDFIES
jgi:hypothetical protein